MAAKASPGVARQPPAWAAPIGEVRRRTPAHPGKLHEKQTLARLPPPDRAPARREGGGAANGLSLSARSPRATRVAGDHASRHRRARPRPAAPTSAVGAARPRNARVGTRTAAGSRAAARLNARKPRSAGWARCRGRVRSNAFAPLAAPRSEHRTCFDSFRRKSNKQRICICDHNGRSHRDTEGRSLPCVLRIVTVEQRERGTQKAPMRCFLGPPEAPPLGSGSNFGTRMPPHTAIAGVTANEPRSRKIQMEGDMLKMLHISKPPQLGLSTLLLLSRGQTRLQKMGGNRHCTLFVARTHHSHTFQALRREVSVTRCSQWLPHQMQPALC